MADVRTLGSWQMTESNYPFLLSRTGAEKSQYEPGLEAYMVLGVIYWPAILVLILLDYLEGLAVAKEGDRCCCRLA